MKNESIDKIIEELDKTRQFVHKFRETGKMPDIERDIVLSKLRNVYEFLQLIQLEEVEILVQKKEPKVVENIEDAPIVSTEPEAITIEFEDSTASEDANIEEDERVIETPEPEDVLVQEPPIPSKPTATPKIEILADKFQTQSFLNEALSQFQNVSDLSKKMQNQPVKDIFSAINLNDKFLFIKELFNNDSALYQSTVEKLNTAGNFNDAVRYLDGNFTWDFNEQMVQNFLELVRRRFL